MLIQRQLYFASIQRKFRKNLERQTFAPLKDFMKNRNIGHDQYMSTLDCQKCQLLQNREMIKHNLHFGSRSLLCFCHSVL